MICTTCNGNSIVEARRPIDLRKLCSCKKKTPKRGWTCTSCGELWYNTDKHCDCGNGDRRYAQRVFFIDEDIETTRSVLSNLWVELKNLF